MNLEWTIFENEFVLVVSAGRIEMCRSIGMDSGRIEEVQCESEEIRWDYKSGLTAGPPTLEILSGASSVSVCEPKTASWNAS